MIDFRALFLSILLTTVSSISVGSVSCQEALGLAGETSSENQMKFYPSKESFTQALLKHSPNLTSNFELDRAVTSYLNNLQLAVAKVKQSLEKNYGIQVKTKISLGKDSLTVSFDPLESFTTNLTLTDSVRKMNLYGDHYNEQVPRSFRSQEEVQKFLLEAANLSIHFESFLVSVNRAANAFGLHLRHEIPSHARQILSVPGNAKLVRAISHPEKTRTLYRGIKNIDLGSDPVEAVIQDSIRSTDSGLPKFLKMDISNRLRTISEEIIKRKDALIGKSELLVGTSDSFEVAQTLAGDQTIVSLRVPLEALEYLGYTKESIFTREREFVVPFCIHKEWIETISHENMLVYSRRFADKTPLAPENVKDGMRIAIHTSLGSVKIGIVRKDSFGLRLDLGNSVQSLIFPNQILQNGIFLVDENTPP